MAARTLMTGRHDLFGVRLFFKRSQASRAARISFMVSSECIALSRSDGHDVNAVWQLFDLVEHFADALFGGADALFGGAVAAHHGAVG